MGGIITDRERCETWDLTFPAFNSPSSKQIAQTKGVHIWISKRDFFVTEIGIIELTIIFLRSNKK